MRLLVLVDIEPIMLTSGEWSYKAAVKRCVLEWTQLGYPVNPIVFIQLKPSQGGRGYSKPVMKGCDENGTCWAFNIGENL